MQAPKCTVTGSTQWQVAPLLEGVYTMSSSFLLHWNEIDAIPDRFRSLTGFGTPSTENIFPFKKMD